MYLSKNPKRMTFYIYLALKDWIGKPIRILGMIILGLGGVVSLIGQTVMDLNRDCSIEQRNYDHCDYFNEETLLGTERDMYKGVISWVKDDQNML